MRSTIDKAGRVVIPKPMREVLGLEAGTEIDIVIDGASIRIDGPQPNEPESHVVDGWFTVLSTGEAPSIEDVRRAREEMQDRNA